MGIIQHSRPLRVLVVDDCRDQTDTLSLLLRLTGHDVAVAYDGAAALQAACALRPDVALVDLEMPGMDGYEVARRLRQLDACRDAVLVALTGHGQERDKRRCREAGFDDHLLKPVELERLQLLLATRQPQPT